MAGEIPCHKVVQNDDFLAFLDINPLTKGHTLVIPKQETDYIFDLEDDALGAMMVFAKKVAHAIQTKVECKRIGITVIGLEVPHAHIHLVPINTMMDMNFSSPKETTNHSALSALAESIHGEFLKSF